MPKEILIVDDDTMILAGLRRILEMKGYTTHVFPNGDILLKDLPFRPNLILLDKQLAGMDGAEMCKSLKRRANTSGIPVILMSSVEGLKTIAEDAGADDFIEKPFVIPELLKKVKAAILTYDAPTSNGIRLPAL